MLREGFTLLRNSGLKEKLEKRKFLRKEIKYLGVKITQEEIKTDSEKVEVIMSVFPLEIASKLRHS